LNYEALANQMEAQLKSDPTNVRLLNRLAIAKMETQGCEKALEVFKKAAESCPTVQSLNNLGYFYLYEGEPNDDGSFSCASSKAIDVLEQATSLNPTSEYPFSLLGKAYLVAKRDKEAEEVLIKAVSLAPDQANQNNLGIALYRQGRIEEAAYWFSKAQLSSSSGDISFKPHLNYGVCLAQLGRTIDAEKIADFLITNDEAKDDIDLLDVSQIYYETLKYSKVVELFDNYQYSWSFDWAIIYLFCLTQCQRKSQAETLLKEAIHNNLLEIEEIKVDDDDEWTEQERMDRIKDLALEIDKYREEYSKIVAGDRPPVNFQPYEVSKCYLFGCYRHNNPEYEGEIVTGDIT